MAKVSGSYESVIRGVSEQVPQDRRSGQHYDQINLLSDPVRGLARRHGSILLDERIISGGDTISNILADTKYHKTFTFRVDGVEYDLIYRTAPAAAGQQSFAFAYNRSTESFIPVVIGSDTTANLLVSGGVSAVVNVGRYLYIAGNSITPAYTTVDQHAADANKRYSVVWVRGGAFSRTFQLTVTKNDGTKVNATYTTASSSYQGNLSTSDILTSDPDYQKKVNDRVYAYNNEVTKWIGTSAADITPGNIATKLAAALVAAGISGASAAGTTGVIAIDNTNVASIQAFDGGDNSLMRAVANEVQAAELVSPFHYVGKIVKIKPRQSSGGDAVYVQAHAKDELSTGFAEVHWKEAAGTVFTPTTMFGMATIVDGTLYIAGGPTALQTLAGLTVPPYLPNAVGDVVSSPPPTLFGEKITYLGMFQDRLVVGSGATIFMSRPGDYLNLWRQSVLTVEDSDPWEGYALGAEDDVIKWSTTWDKDLILYGLKFQYSISGRIPLTPSTASIQASSSYKDATDAQPKASGNYVFYARYTPDEDGTYKTSLHQVGQGPIAESPESYEASQQLDRYIVGKPVEIIANAAPNLVLLRTDETRQQLATYAYLDTPNGGERLFDSWSKWVWHPAVGDLAGMAVDKGTVLCFLVRRRNNTNYIACERFSLNTGLSNLPYADSLQPRATALANTAMVGTSGAIVALANDGQPHSLMGTDYSNMAAFDDAYPTALSRAWVGFPPGAWVTPTNPFMRDPNTDKPILAGRLTLGQVRVTVADTGGMVGEVTSNGVTATVLDFDGRILGSTAFTVGSQPVVSTALPLWVGKEVRDCSYTLRAKTWLPLTITNLDWTGQSFNNLRRV